MQVSIRHERFGFRYAPLTVHYAALGRYLTWRWTLSHPDERALPSVVSDAFFAEQIDKALREAQSHPPIEPESIHSLDVARVAGTASEPRDLVMEPLTAQIDELLLCSTTSIDLSKTSEQRQPHIGEKNWKHISTNLFFALASAAFRDSCAASMATGEITTLDDHSPLFQRCVGVFQRCYGAHVRAVVPPHLSSVTLTESVFAAYRAGVLAVFPTADGGVDEAAQKMVRQFVAHSAAAHTGHPPSVHALALRVTPTLSTLAVKRRPKASPHISAPAPPSQTSTATPPPLAVVNDAPMTESERLLTGAEWKNVTDPRCPSCGAERTALTTWYPGWLKRKPVNCRACGRVLCNRCVTEKAHFSFAKLSEPGTREEGTLRLVCDTCFKSFKGFRQLRFLGSLFIFSGFDFAHVLLSLGVGHGWTAAAELCVSDHRFLLHTLASHATYVLSPMRVLLQNSAHLFISAAPPTQTGSPPRPRAAVIWHPEALLKLLQFVSEDRLWGQPEVRALVEAVSHSRLAHRGSCPSDTEEGATEAAPLSHYHMWCTQLCTQMRPFSFFMEALEHLATAPRSCEYVREALPIVADCARASIASVPAQLPASSPLSGVLGHFATAHAANECAVSERELVTVWLLDLLWRPRTPTALSTYEAVCTALPALVSHQPQLLCWVLCMLHQHRERVCTSPLETPVGSRGRLEEAVGSLILDRVTDGTLRERAKETVDVLKRLDRWVREKPSSRFTVPEISAWFACNYAVTDNGDVGFHRGGTRVTARSALEQVRRRSQRAGPVNAMDYLDLRRPLCDPIHPTGVTLRSLFLPGMRAEKSSLGKVSPVWLCFSNWSKAHRALASEMEDPSSASSSSDSSAHARLRQLEETEGAVEEHHSFLYKLESVDADNLMCVSFRLLRWLLHEHLGPADIPLFGVLPLSPNSGLIERAPGVPLARVEDLQTYLMHLPSGTAAPVAARNFLTSLKLFLLLNHIFGIGDRHTSNVMISPSGAIFHIDFGYVFHQRPPHEFLSPAVRLDRHILTAANACRRILEPETPASSTASPPASDPPASVSDGGAVRNAHTGSVPVVDTSAVCALRAEDWFCDEVADLLIHVRPHAVLFYHLWLYAVHQSQLLGGSDRALAEYFNRLFDTTAFVESCRTHFIAAMHQSISKWALKDNSRNFTYSIFRQFGF